MNDIDQPESENTDIDQPESQQLLRNSPLEAILPELTNTSYQCRISSAHKLQHTRISLDRPRPTTKTHTPHKNTIKRTRFPPWK